eukprot:613858-Rhodomonas_salina.3
MDSSSSSYFQRARSCSETYSAEPTFMRTWSSASTSSGSAEPHRRNSGHIAEFVNAAHRSDTPSSSEFQTKVPKVCMTKAAKVAATTAVVLFVIVYGVFIHLLMSKSAYTGGATSL